VNGLTRNPDRVGGALTCLASQCAFEIRDAKLHGELSLAQSAICPRDVDLKVLLKALDETRAAQGEFINCKCPEFRTTRE